MIGVNVQVGMKDPGVPVLAVVPDWCKNPQAVFAGFNVILWRTMDRDGYQYLPDDAHVVFSNEDDEGDRSYRLAQVAKIRAERPNMKIHVPAEKWQERDQYDPAMIAACDVIDIHSPVFESVGVTPDSDPFWITELEADPAIPDQMNQLFPVAVQWEEAGIPWVFIWGADQQRADVNDHPEIIAAIKAHNAQGAARMASIEERLAQLEKQIPLQTEGLRRVTEGKYNGAAGSAGIVVELEGGNTTVNAQPDYVPNP